ncbi:MAG: hypothetical protein KIS92_02770, partial [Planctomycetota bacterium]|nr:hypothetical protein [Planctomycetota bacterium]
MQIVYCESCGRRISESDLENKLAFPLDENRYTCAQCAPAGTPGTQPVPRVGPSTKARVQPTRSSRATSARLKPAIAQGGKALPPALLGVGALILIAGLYFLFSGGREPVK